MYNIVQAEDLECLCYLMKACGKFLDTPKAKVRNVVLGSMQNHYVTEFAHYFSQSLMDQYFKRLQKATENELLPVRIRFIVQVTNFNDAVF
jgi:hypothetical protein